MDRPRALLFDVQGTATDFYFTVCAEAERISAGRYQEADWGAFVTRWRAAYFTAVNATPMLADRWTSVHSIYRDTLVELLDAGGFTFASEEVEELTLAWQKLRPWPDSIAGLTRLRTRYTLATLSNADVSAVVNLSKRAGLPWDAIFTAEMAGAFKPDPTTYRMAATYLGLDPADIMMVASHKYDLRAAAGLGMRTAFVARPLEFGAGADVDVTFETDFDINAFDFIDLANQLGC